MSFNYDNKWCMEYYFTVNILMTQIRLANLTKYCNEKQNFPKESKRETSQESFSPDSLLDIVKAFDDATVQPRPVDRVILLRPLCQGHLVRARRVLEG